MSRGLFYILERFHLNHRAAFSNSDHKEILEIEEELVALGAKCILLTISPEIVEERIKSRRPDEWINKTEVEIKESSNELMNAQNEYRLQAEISKIPTFEINTDMKTGMNMQD
jgi:hypothetical protein